MTFEEMSESLTGFDEIAVEKTLGIDVYTDGERKPVLMMRALVFVHMRRLGKTDPEAKQAVMEMPLSAVNDYFETDQDEVLADEPDSESGKGDTQPV